MKKMIVGLFCMVLIVNAQAQQVSFGIKGGANLVKLSGNSFNNNMKAGIQAGGFAATALNKKWGLQAEVIFSNLTLDKTTDFDKIYSNKQNQYASLKSRLCYISFPVLATHKLYKHLSIYAGPQFSIACFRDENLFRDNTPAFKTTDVAIAGGVQFDISIAKLYARYTYGLTNINNYDNRDTWKNRQLTLGLEIPLFSTGQR